jgi:hypothetical protein
MLHMSLGGEEKCCGFESSKCQPALRFGDSEEGIKLKPPSYATQKDREGVNKSPSARGLAI